MTSAWVARACFERVGKALLHDPIGGEVDSWRERDTLPVEVQFDGQPGAVDVLDQRVEAVKAGLRREL
ncbi:MAG: hypothetical protein ACLP8S_22655 [Solirubrobacteraceae bacterium]